MRAVIAETGFAPVFGARPLKRVIQDRIENPLAKPILEGHFAAKDRIVVEAKRGRSASPKPDWRRLSIRPPYIPARSRIALRR